jgi:hypothetical protein
MITSLTWNGDLHINRTYEPLLGTDWILNLDATVKPLYREQEEARLGYNPHKPGRPSHVYQAFLCSAAKLVLNVDVQAGNQTASEYAQPVLWGWLDARERAVGPSLQCGDLAHGSENMMKEAEARNLPYLFKLLLQLDPVGAGPFGRLEGLDREAHLFAERTGEKAAHRMRHPAGF